MALIDSLADSPIGWQLFYALLPPAYALLVFAPRSRLADRVFGTGLYLALPVAYLTVFAVVGTAAWGLDLFEMLVRTERDLGHLQVVAAFCITATAADLTFAWIFLRRYADLPVLAKMFCAFWILMIGWLLGVVIYLVVRRLYKGRVEAVRIGPFVIDSVPAGSRQRPLPTSSR